MNRVSLWCEGIKPLSHVQREMLSILSDGEVWKLSEVEVHSRFAHRNITSALKTLMKAGRISKPKLQKTFEKRRQAPMDPRQMQLYEREVEAREKQAEALDRIADALNLKVLDNKYGIENIADAVALLARVIEESKENPDA